MKMIKKCLALVLALALICIPAISVSAASAKEADIKRDCPEINVHGFMSSGILYDKDDPSQGYIWDWSQEEIMDLIRKALPVIAKYFILSDWDGMADALIPLVLDFFDGCIPNPDGSAAGNTGVEFEYPSPKSIKKDSKVDFSYDWRLDPIECAEQLNDFIEYVCECSGCDQVTLTCHSQGGVITTSYVSLYGYSRLKSVVFNTTAIYGETYTGELLSGKMTLNADAVQYYLQYAFDGMDYEKLINGVIQVANDLGLLDFICEFGNIVLEKLSPKVLPEVVVPLFAGMPSIWAMVPDEDMDASMDYVFNTVYKDSDIDRSALIEKIENYNTLVRANKTETLKALNDNAYMYVISRYGYSSIPIIPSYASMSDSVIDTSRSSFGATVADYKNTLTDEQLAGADSKYVSPDKMVYAGTCMFPDQTWFIKNFPHAINSPLSDMIDTLLYTEFQATVDTYDEYPQFMQYNREERTISPYTVTDALADLPWYQKFLNYLETLTAKLIELFRKITALVNSVR